MNRSAVSFPRSGKFSTSMMGIFSVGAYICFLPLRASSVDSTVDAEEY